MKKVFLMGFVILGVISSAIAQAQPQRDVEKEKRNAKEAAYNSRVDALRNNGKQIYIRDRYKEDRIFIDVIRPLYRSDLTPEETTLLMPINEDTQQYADFLGNKKTGIFKLLVDKGCDGGTETVSAKPECENLTMPGAGSSYSFRAERYSIQRLADLTFTGKKFETEGLVKHSVMVNLGDVPLDDVNMKTKNLQTLVSFKPITDFEKASQMSALLKKGVATGDLVFSSWLKVKENSTYALRSVAYKTRVSRQIQDTVYDEFDFDEREDVLIAFRVVRLVPDESVTIVWKEMNKNRSPKILLPKEKRNY